MSRYNYDAFGARELEAGAELMDVGFTGREYDAETDLYHYRARDYDPDVGRFVQSDPIGFAAGDLNLYAYTWNDPSNWSDPSGLAVTSDWVVKTAQVVRLAARAVTQGAKRAAKGLIREAAEDSIESTTLCLGSTVGSVIGSYARNYAAGNRSIDEDAIQRVAECAAVVIPLPCGCDGDDVGPGESFVPGTAILTPQGKVAIEDLRKGDLVLARHEDTGEIGQFLVAALMARQAPNVIWLTLENTKGEASRLGVTTEHPMYVVGKGWTEAVQIGIGDAVRSAELEPLAVVSVEPDRSPQLVHNLEISGAQTYFVGDLDAWAHNKSSTKNKKYTPKKAARRIRCGSKKKAYQGAKKAGKGKEPVHHPSDPKGPHYHPNVPNSCSQTSKQPNNHWHFFY